MDRQTLTVKSSRAFEFSCCLLLLIGSANAAAEHEIDDFEASIKAERFLEVREPLKKYCALHPGSWQALYQLGYTTFRLHRLQESVESLCKSILLKKDFAESHKILAYDLNILGHPELALKELETAIRCDPSSVESHYELGRLYFEQGDYSHSVRELESAKALAPESARVYHNLGLAYSGLNDHVRAVENFEAGLRKSEKQAQRSPWPFIDYATYLNTQQKYETARDLLLQALSIDGSVDREYDELSKAYRGLHLIGKAIEALKQAIAMNPNKAESHYVLSRLYVQTGKDADAEAELKIFQRMQKF